MESGKRKMVAIALVAVLVVAAAAVVLVSGVMKTASYTASVTDAAGNKVFLNKTPERIVSCSPAISEIVCSLGLGDKMVAVTSYDDYPAQAKDLVLASHTIGGFYTPNFESIVSYNPDLVLVNSGVPSHQAVAQQLKEAGYTVVQLYAQENLEEVYKSIELVGNISGKQAKATEVISAMDDRIAEIGAKIGSGASKPSVMYVSYTEPGFTNVWPSGADTAIDEIISMAGGVNVFADQSGWLNPSQEVLIDRAASVDCLVITSMYSGSDAENMTAFFKADPIWQNSPAVINNKIYYLQGQAESIFNRQTVRMVDAVQLLAEMLHPGVFSSQIPSDPSGVNLIGDEYENYLTPGTSSQTTSTAIVATSSRD